MTITGLSDGSSSALCFISGREAEREWEGAILCPDNASLSLSPLYCRKNRENNNCCDEMRACAAETPLGHVVYCTGSPSIVISKHEQEGKGSLGMLRRIHTLLHSNFLAHRWLNSMELNDNVGW